MIEPSPLPVFPRLGVGALKWGLHPPGTRGADACAPAEREAFETCLAAGATLVDTAEVYNRGRSERRLAELAAGRDVMIATKFLPWPWRRPGDLGRALSASLARLRRDSVALYQIHFPVPWMRNRDLMRRLADAVEAGRARAVGVSNFSPSQVREAHAVLASRGVALASNQVQYSLLHRDAERDGLLETCRELGVTLIAYSPLAMGALTGRHAPGWRPGGARRHFSPLQPSGLSALRATLPLLQEIGARHGRTVAQVALRWLMEQDGVVPIPGARDGRQAAENVGALSFSLEPAEVEALAAVTPPRRPGGRGG